MHFESIPGEKGAKLVFGLEWRAYSAKGASAERRRYAQDLGATHYTEIKAKDETIAGFCELDASQRKGGKLYSAAARIATLDRVRRRPAVLVLIQNDERVHLVLVLRGAVSVDEEVALNALADRREEIEDQCAKAGLTLATLGHGALLHALDESFELRELLVARKVGLIKKVPVAIPTAVPLLVILAAVFFGGKQLIDVLNPPPPPPAPPPTFMQEYQAAVMRTLGAPAPLANMLAPRLLASFGTQESNVAGWQFEKASCSIAGPCVVTYKRQGGTFKEFDTRAPETLRPIVFNPDGWHLTTRGPEVTVAERVALAQQKTWPNQQALIKALQTDPQKLSTKPDTLDSHGYVVDIKPAERLIPRQPMAGEVQGPLVQRGTWQIDGYKWQSALLARLPDNMALDTLDVELKEDGTGVHFTAKGKYYVLN
ncbi:MULTISPECIES: hypothetical protein [unclassified Caballeronia]|uniref:hypothetical protein n=1 Tax=unclassified Caballeronia TaxID=2646786 RepID=UPI0028601913|nr:MULTISPECIES: hypothetical protein [unclassified Caballeronia]MDR5776873.1 hypothetical protein [Caballeronia sp. LZ002]MDR5798821.1 hypothetical protein [Caballeronia sp. LZ001]MDR5852342.1 hypothetical protein [Caballeronia sp. LZ003]